MKNTFEEALEALRGPNFEMALAEHGPRLLEEFGRLLPQVVQHIRGLEACLREARSELDADECLVCGEVWPKCECENGQWWRDAGNLLGESHE